MVIRELAYAEWEGFGILHLYEFTNKSDKRRKQQSCYLGAIKKLYGFDLMFCILFLIS